MNSARFRSWLFHQFLHLAMAICLFVAGIVFKTLHDMHSDHNPPLSL